MGRIVPKQIKQRAIMFFEKYKDVVSDNFETNKQLIQKTTKVGSKKVRNVMAGYLTRYAKQYRMKFQ